MDKTTYCRARFTTQYRMTFIRDSPDGTLSEAEICFVLAVMMDQKAPWAAKIAAAIAVLDRGWGRPTQAVDANVNIFDQMTDDEQKTMLAALRLLRTPNGQNLTSFPIGSVTR
jgi:hypothetical protein